ncbi:hypothetical protein CYY_007365 [Polysphondylium violaceum]|uniref:MIT domain-containing protein n=1 Tax=Polysphondylium violaceum TaxID=133409 RepID=A0A8J4PR27_9MYCE|nr:hypothetical protein CYY_007365 [Polysphondylium violaceum]
MSALQNALGIVKKAVDLDNQGKSQEAISMYSLAIDHLQQVATTNDTKTRDLIQSKIVEYQSRVQFLKSTLHLNSPNNINSSSNSFPSPPPLQQYNNNNKSLVDVAVEYANLAVNSESSNQIQNAIMYYKKCADVLEQASKETDDIETRLMLNQKKQEYNARADSLSSSSSSSFVNSNSNSNSNSNLPFQVDDPNLFNSNTNSSGNNLFLNNSNGIQQPQQYIELSNNSTEFVDMAINYATEAIEQDDHLNYEKAIHFYDLSVQYFTAALQHESNQQIRQLILDKSTNSRIRSTFLKNKIQYNGGNNSNSEFSSIPMALQPGQKYKDPVRKKTVFEKLSKTIKGPKNISDHWL